jgi:hypothetical protein
VAYSRNSLQSSHPMGEAGNRGRVEPTWGKKGLPGRINTPVLVQALPAVHLHTFSHLEADHRPTPVHPWRTCCRHRYATSQTPCHYWLASRPMDKRRPPGQSRGSAGPPQGGVCDARKVCVTHSHFWAKIVTPVHPPAHPRPPLSTYDAHLVNKGKQKLRKGVHRVAGCWSLGAGVSRPKPIGDYGYPWILILIHIRPNP